MATNIYLDVDGVVNSLRKSKSAGWQGDYKLETINKYPIHWYTDLVDSINTFESFPDVKVKWLTTWQYDAPTKLSPVLGIADAEWEVLTVPEGQELFNQFSWWKLHALKADIIKDRPDKVVWIDDDLSYARDALTWIEDQEITNLLPISPFTEWGMTKEEFDDIIEFINA
jgi:hypothetical protein